MSHFNIRGPLLFWRLVFFNYIVDMIKTELNFLTYWRRHFFSLFSGHKGRHLDFETWNKVQLYCFIVFQKKTKMIIRKLLKFDLKSQSETKLLRFFNFDDNGGWLINDFWVRFLVTDGSPKDHFFCFVLWWRPEQVWQDFRLGWQLCHTPIIIQRVSNYTLAD